VPRERASNSRTPGIAAAKPRHSGHHESRLVARRGRDAGEFRLSRATAGEQFVLDDHDRRLPVIWSRGAFHERHALLLSASPSMGRQPRRLGLARPLARPFEHLGASIRTCSRSRGPPRPRWRRTNRERGVAATLPDDDRQLHAPGRGIEAPLRKSLWVESLGEHPKPAIDYRTTTCCGEADDLPGRRTALGSTTLHRRVAPD
jgi:hypothetical protein